MKPELTYLALCGILILSTASAAEFSNADICKAAISVEMGRPSKMMKLEQPGDEPLISYQRPDGDRFRYICKIEKERVVWRTYLSDTNSWGRWRNSESYGDAVTTFAIARGALIISNNQLGEKTFKANDF